MKGTRYRILHSLGKGGMGEVFLAEDTRLERKVALKFLAEDREQDSLARQRLEREAKSAAALDHPFICKIYEIGETEERTFIAMEYVAGETLCERLWKGALPLKEGLRYAAEICEALDEAHKRRIVHRDLKPANIMLTEQGHVKVMDFGLAKEIPGALAFDSQAETREGKLTRPGIRVGTPVYMSPEQLAGVEVDARSDIFSFGLVLYEMLTGTHPFQKSNLAETLGAILRDIPETPSRHRAEVPTGFGRLVERLLAKEPANRFPSFQEVRVELARLMEETPAPVSAAPVGRRTSFVGREAERAELRRLLERAQRGEGALALIGGEPGIGKTRLAEELLAEARARRMLALVGHCYEMEGAPPFVPFVEILEQACRMVDRSAFREALGDAAPEVARLVPGLRNLFVDIPQPLELPREQQRRYLFTSFREFTERAARRSPMVLLLDDLHWAEESTLQLLQHLAPHLSTMPVVVLGTYRDVELDVARPFARTLETLLRQRFAHRLSLRRLAEPGVGEMLGALSGREAPPGLVRVIYQETEGNPFFVEEVFAHLSEAGKLLDEQGQWKGDLRIEELEVPEGVRLVIGRRLERLREETRRALTAAALIGRDFTLELLGGLTDLGEEKTLEALEEAERAHLLSTRSAEREVRYAFEHELIRHTLVSSLSLPRRQRTHLRVAEAMERVYGAHVEEHASDVAYHLYQAGAAADPQKTVSYLTQAGDRALGAAASEEALRQYQSALALQESADSEDYAALLVKRGRALNQLGRLDEALADWESATTVYDKLGRREAVARICYDSTYALLWLLRLEDGLKTAQRGIEAAGREPTAERSLLLASAGLALSLSCEFQAGEARFAEAVAAADTLGDRRTLGVVLAYYAIHYVVQLKLGEGFEAVMRASELLRSARDLWHLADALAFAVFFSIFCGRLDSARNLVAELEPLANRLENLVSLWGAVRGRVYLTVMESGNLEAIAESARNDLELHCRASLPWVAYSHVFLGFADLWRGRFEEALPNFETAVALERPGPMVGVAEGALFLGKVYAGREDAAELVRQIGLPRPGESNRFGAWFSVPCLVEGLAMLGEKERAAELYPLVDEAIGTGAVIGFTFPLFEKVAGIAAAAGGKWEKAEEHFQAALRQAHEVPHRLEQPEVRRWYARMLIDRNRPGDRDRARKLLNEASEAYQRIGMPRHVAMAEEMRREL